MGKRIVVVLPVYRAEKTVQATFRDLPHDVVDTILLVDDASPDGTVKVARELGIKTFVHHENLGYSANQKTCYREAVAADADITVMVHRDYQYDPRLVTAMAAMIGLGDLRRGSGLQDSWQHGEAGRHASVQVHFEPRSYGVREHHAGQ